MIQMIERIGERIARWRRVRASKRTAARQHARWVAAEARRQAKRAAWEVEHADWRRRMARIEEENAWWAWRQASDAQERADVTARYGEILERVWQGKRRARAELAARCG